MKEILFTINDEGEISMEVKGAVGASCDEFTAPFENELGTVATKERKSEFYATEVTEDVVSDGGSGV